MNKNRLCLHLKRIVKKCGEENMFGDVAREHVQRCGTKTCSEMWHEDMFRDVARGHVKKCSVENMFRDVAHC